MKSIFPGYYQKSEEELKHIWEEGLYCFDTNCLLNLYRYSDESLKDWLSLLAQIDNKLRLPFRAAYEFQRNRRNVIRKERENLENSINSLEKEIDKTENIYRSNRRFSRKELEELNQKHKELKDSYTKLVDEHLKKIPDYLESDTIRDSIDKLFSEKIIINIDEKDYEKIAKEGEERFKHNIPPGFCDNSKENKYCDRFSKYGDLIIWKEIISEAKKEKRPIVFVTDDNKEDWWLKEKGKTISEHPFLINEFEKEAGQLIKIYKPDQFLKFSKDYFGDLAKAETISEAEEVSKQAQEDAKYERELENFKRGFYNAISKQEMDLFNSVNSNEEYLYKLGQINSAKTLYARREAIKQLAKKGTISDDLRKKLEEYDFLHKKFSKAEDKD